MPTALELANVEIYNHTLPATLTGRSARTLVFPSYTPDAEGTIVWTATISDADPDFDDATATTKVVLTGNGHHGGGGSGDDDDDDDHD